MVVGEHALTVQAFVARHVDENAEVAYCWLLERNLRMYGVAFAGSTPLGDIYLSGRMPLSSVTPDEVDRLLGSVLEYADGSFNTILELGFSTAIRREWSGACPAASRRTTSTSSATSPRPTPDRSSRASGARAGLPPARSGDLGGLGAS